MTDNVELSRIWPASALTLMGEHWIESPFQLAALAATAGGVDTIAQVTGLDGDQVAELVARTRALLSHAERAEVARPINLESTPLGVLPPKK